MSTYNQVTALRNTCFKISKLGSNTERYGALRQIALEAFEDRRRYVPDFIVSCEDPVAVRNYLSTLFPNDEEGGVYKRRRQFLERSFAELIYWSERDALLPAEITALEQVDLRHRSTMDHVLRLMRDCAEIDPRRSILLSRHTLLEGASYLLYSNGVWPDVGSGVQVLIEQIVEMAAHSNAAQDVNFSPDQTFVKVIMPLAIYIDKQNTFYSWEEGNRKPDYPTTQDARHFLQAATLLCDVIWHWTLDDIFPPERQEKSSRLRSRF